MNIQQAVQNIDIVLKETRMSRAEHQELQGNLQFLTARAKKVDELEQEMKDRDAAKKEPEVK